jgi:predicted ArsR family transcriptional regulator
MTTGEKLTDPDSAVVFGEMRSRVWAVLQRFGRPVTVGEMAQQIGLHSNTARFHLDALVEAGVADRANENRDRPGRPRALYIARADAPSDGRRSYRLLAEILTSSLAAQLPQPAKAAVKAGAAWGKYLADKPAPFQRINAAVATEQLVSVLDDIGFAPEAVTTTRKRRVLLHRCPFLEVAESHQDVICSIHLGLMRGLLAELGAPIQADRLDPFVEPSLCVVHLSAKPVAP